MRLKIIMPGTAVAAVLLLNGCTTTPEPPMREDFGDAVRTNIAAQVIDPTAGQEEMPVGTLDGQKVEAGVQRYREARPEAETRRLLGDLIGN